MESMVRTNDPLYAAEKAGYTQPATSAWKLMNNPLVAAATREGTAQFLREKGGALGVMVLAELAVDDKVQPAVRRAAAKDLAMLGGMGTTEGATKDLSEMTGEELAREIARATARQAALQHVAAERARPMIEGELVDEVEAIEEADMGVLG